MRLTRGFNACTTLRAVNLSEQVGEAKELPRVCGRQRNQEKYPAASAVQQLNRTVICSELKSLFSKEKGNIISSVLLFLK